MSGNRRAASSSSASGATHYASVQYAYLFRHFDEVDARLRPSGGGCW
ncbi:hypothetical protein ACNKHR_17420 [Shigella flexneri]